MNIDLTEGTLRELDARAAKINMSREAVIKNLVDEALHSGRRPDAQSRVTDAECSLPEGN
jgi:hypothetical protein